MKKITILLAILLGFLSSCKDENDPKIISNEYYLINATDVIVKISGDNANKYLVPNHKSEIIYGDKYDTGEFKYIDSQKIIMGDIILIYGHSNDDGKYLQVIDYELKVSDSVNTENSTSINNEYHFKITNEVLRDIEKSMEAKGYVPQPLKDQPYGKYFL